MQIVLKLNSITMEYEVQKMGDKIIEVAQGNVEEGELAEFLRSLVIDNSS